MKIAIDCRMSGKSGIGTFLDGILPYFSDGANTLLLLGISSLPESFPFTTNCSCFPCNIKPFSIRELFFFPRNIAKRINECDVYFTPYCNIPNGITIPIFSTIHDIVFLDMPGLADKWGTMVRKFFYQYAINKSKAIFTVSEFSKSRIQVKLNCKKTIYVVYNGIPKYLEKKLVPKPLKTNTIIYIGNIKTHKGLGTLLQAFVLFSNSHYFSSSEKPKLIIVGSNENFRTKDVSISDTISKASKDDIVFTGHISDDELHVLLTEARILVQPSLYEGFGIPPLEALYSGTNVILSDIPVFREIYAGFPVTFFHAGDSADLCDKMVDLWNKTEEPLHIPNKYSYQQTANRITSALCNNLS